jgi:alkanesulfonate monooxygenase SsuD/methylene tetrahydromethanopterin reductase-like flavin-dependent oxidoreductase (luciferase family)
MPRWVTRLGVWLGDPLSSANDHSFANSYAVAQAAEEAGFDSLWLSDNVHELDRPSSEISHEAYSLLGALATRTRSIHLGAFPSGVAGRAPAVLAKIVTGLDVISHGRAILSVVSSSESDGKDGDRLAEEIQVCRTVLDGLPEFSGHHYQIQGAINQPRPSQRAGVPVVVVIESSGTEWNAARSAGLRIAARYADAVVVIGGDMRVLGEVADVVKSTTHDRGEHSPSDSIEVIWAGDLISAHSGTFDGAPRTTAALAVQQFRDRLRAGADGCIVNVNSFDSLETIAQVGPALSEVARGTSAPRSQER